MSSKPKKSKTIEEFLLKEDFGTTEEFVCRVCGEVLTTLDNFIDHCRRRHKSLVDRNCIGLPKKCNLCSVYFGSEEGLGKHLRDVHGVDQASSVDEIEEETEEFVPPPVKPTAPKQRRKRKSSVPRPISQEHPDGTSEQANPAPVQEQHEERSFVLPEISQVPAVAITDEIRTQAASSSTETFKCRFCQKTSRSSRDHVRHVRNCNPNATDYDIFDNPHDCPLCHRVFQTRMNLERHFHMKHRGEPWGIMDPNIGAFDACSDLKRVNLTPRATATATRTTKTTLPPPNLQPPNLQRIPNMQKVSPNSHLIPNVHKVQPGSD